MKTLTDVIAEHVLLDNLACKCRWFPAGAVTVSDARRDWAAHVAAVYREARTITTLGELDALPGETVVRDDGGAVLEKVGDSGATRYVWAIRGSNRFLPSAAVRIPALALWTPGDTP